ncbi:sulfate ABC transporter permease [Vibrio sp. IRLE0018]|uniref:sulfate ABC transporter permease n=1 Tax=Vibrio TaxID=662 RepID=UPI001594590C|nr:MULTISPECIES: sulfate ABC transporter permease [Vibrio]MCF8777553.1 sulfate ABC transporter permease [Vibrio floridensis]NVC61538.1 sulfate ABC transporter permease [Vibrio sp. 05-20-BW147]HAS6346693.1 sulfate ABC transporter permease [Vibrio vulnificus]
MRLKFILPLLILCPPTYGEWALSDTLSLSGFGSASASKSNQSIPIIQQKEFTEEWCYDCETTLGLQLDWSMNENWRASLQVVKQPHDEFSDPALAWAFVEYRWDDWSTKVGRQRIPLFLMSEYLFVSQAYPWLRPPIDVYESVLGISNYDGLSLDVQKWITSDIPVRFATFVAKSSSDDYSLYGQPLTIDTDISYGITTEIDFDENLVRAALIHTIFEQTYAATTIIPGGEQSLTLFSLGTIYNWQQWQFIAELLTSNRYHAHWYVSLNYQWNDITPYVTYSQRRKSVENETYSVGLKYSLLPNLSLYGEWLYIQSPKSVISGHFTQPQLPPDQAIGEVDLFSLGISFTF